jgi:hypothetical protein
MAVVVALVATSVSWLPAARPVITRAATDPNAQWTFDEGDGTSATDVSGNGHHGMFIGDPAWVTADPAQGTGALAFDGDDGVEIANAAAFETGVRTIAVRVRAAETPLLTSIVAKGAYDCNGHSYGITTTSQPTASWHTSGWPDQQSLSSSAPGPIWDGEWHHVVLVVGEPYIRFYVDGWQTSTLSGSIVYDGGDLTSANLFIGHPGATCESWHGFSGELDDVRIYDRGLTWNEILAFEEPYDTTTTLTVEPQTTTAGSWVHFGAKVEPQPQSGSVTFYVSKDGGPEEHRGSWPIQWGSAGFSRQDLAVGTYIVRAVFDGFGPANSSESATATHTVSLIPTTVSLTKVGAGPGVSNQPFQLHATTAWGDDLGRGGQPGGTITFLDVTAGGEMELGTVPLTFGCCGGNTISAVLNVAGMPMGDHTFRARYNGSDTISPATDEVAVSIVRGPTTAWLQAGPTTVQTNHEVSFEASLGFAYLDREDVVGAGTLEIREIGTNALIASGPATETLRITLPSLAVGTRTYRAAYAGTEDFLPAQSDPVVITVTADIVEASGVGANYTTFYPYKDGHRDSTTIKGLRHESASVAIRIYSPTNRLVRSVNIAMGQGSYASAWTGRTSTGAMLAAGKYRVVQTLTDLAGTKRVVTTYVTLSAKRLVYTTVTYTRTPSQATKRTSSWAGWQFTLPTATVYKSLTFSVYGRSTSVAGGSFGGQDFTRCPYSTSWSINCVIRKSSVGSTLKWWPRALSPTAERYGRAVRGYVFANPGGVVEVGKVSLKVTYGVLK